jgi:hypothetical protein
MTERRDNVDRHHPVYLAIAIVAAAILQSILVWKLRWGVKQTSPNRPNEDPNN